MIEEQDMGLTNDGINAPAKAKPKRAKRKATRRRERPEGTAPVGSPQDGGSEAPARSDGDDE